jgi:hypothetical protein
MNQNKLTPQQALANLYQASRLAPLTAEQHQALAESAKLIDSIINPAPKEIPKTE